MRSAAGTRRRAVAAGVSVLAAVALATAVAGRGCRAQDASPLGAVRAFVAAARAGDRDALYDLLSPATRARLQKAARRTTELVGGSSRYAATDLIQVARRKQGLSKLRFELRRRGGGRAVVDVIAPNGQRSALHLVEVNGSWRIALPAAAATRDRDRDGDGARRRETAPD